MPTFSFSACWMPAAFSTPRRASGERKMKLSFRISARVEDSTPVFGRRVAHDVLGGHPPEQALSASARAAGRPPSGPCGCSPDDHPGDQRGADVAFFSQATLSQAVCGSSAGSRIDDLALGDFEGLVACRAQPHPEPGELGLLHMLPGLHAERTHPEGDLAAAREDDIGIAFGSGDGGGRASSGVQPWCTSLDYAFDYLGNPRGFQGLPGRDFG